MTGTGNAPSIADASANFAVASATALVRSKVETPGIPLRSCRLGRYIGIAMVQRDTVLSRRVQAAIRETRQTLIRHSRDPAGDQWIIEPVDQAASPQSASDSRFIVARNSAEPGSPREYQDKCLRARRTPGPVPNWLSIASIVPQQD